MERCPRVTTIKKCRNAFPSKCGFYYPIFIFLNCLPSRLILFWAFCLIQALPQQFCSHYLLTVLGTVKWQQTVHILAQELSICHVLTLHRMNLWPPQSRLWVEKAMVGLWGQHSGE